MWMWIALVIGALLTGAFMVAVLVSPRRAETVFILSGLLAAGVVGYLFTTIAAQYQRLDAIGYAAAVLALGLVGGWALTASLLEKTVPEHVLPAITIPPAEQARTAVVVTACVETSEYSVPSTAAILRDLDEEDLIRASLSSIPLLHFSQKSRYRAIGGTSPACQEVGRIADGLSAILSRDRFAPARVACCTRGNRLVDVVAGAVNEGFRAIVVVELSVGESLEAAEAKREVDALRLAQHGVTVSYTGQLCGSDALVEMLTDRVCRALETHESTGVALIGHGQTERHARLNPGFDEAENSFLNRLKVRLLEEGLPEQHVRIAWAEWDSPDVTSAVRHLAALGCRRVLIVPAVFCVDTMVTLLDLELAVRQARVDEEVSTVTLPAWGSDEALVAELARQVEALA